MGLRWIGARLIGEPGAYPALDGLRAFAILLVLARHATLPFANFDSDSLAAVQGVAWLVLRNGWLGVDLFFVLSGFLIARTLSHERHRGWTGGFPSSYLKKRVLRTFPLYYAIIAICMLGVLPGYSIEVDRPLVELAIHAVFLQDYLGTQLLVPLWSLATEEKFYLLAPFLVAIVWRQDHAGKRLAFLSFLMMLSVAARAMNWMVLSPDHYPEFFWQVRAPFHGCLDGLMVGVICFELSRIAVCKRVIEHRAGVVLATSAGAAIVILGAREWAQPGTMGMTLLAIPAFSVCCGAALLASLFIKGRGLRFMGSRSLRVLARLSYALYLTHYTTIEASVAWAEGLAGGSAGFVPLFLIFYLFLSFAYAVVLHLAIERPFLRLKARIR
ncbi:acyltransferase family protein [Halomonas denitrificans]|nr:acyltransferase [Halomonas denitrificans]